MTASHEASRAVEVHALCLRAVLLAGLWLVLSGMYDLFHLGLGVICVGAVLWFSQRIPRPPATHPGLGHDQRLRLRQALLYGPWLTWQIVVSTFQVARLIISPTIKLHTTMIEFRSPQPSVAATVALANAITLTPGTLTVDLDGDRFLVHALDLSTAEALIEGTMQRRTADLFGGSSEELVQDVRWEGHSP